VATSHTVFFVLQYADCNPQIYRPTCIPALKEY